MITQQKLYDLFGAPYNLNDQGEAGRLYISREAQKYFAIREKESRETVQEEFSKLIAKGHTAFLKEQVPVDTPLITTDVLAMRSVSKYDDSKLDAKKLEDSIRAEFKCSADRAKAVIKSSRVKPEKISLIVARLD